MELGGARQVLETTSQETANQYIRFGWKLINQHVVEETESTPRMIKYVLASLSRLEDTRQIEILTNAGEVNQRLAAGWRLIDKFVTSLDEAERRQETLHFVLAWPSDDPPQEELQVPRIAADIELRYVNNAERNLAMEEEASYVCESCGEEIVVPIDASAGRRQEYVEDCPVCCHPNVLEIEIDRQGHVHVSSRHE